jgi:divalent metal cation (Fe/Co/Zn/Cd) transporter
MFATYEGIEKIRHPHELESVTVAIVILVVAIILETFSFRTAILESRKVKDPRSSWWTFVRRSKNPELPVVLLEDLAAEAGLILALSAVSIAHATGDAVWDGIGTLIIGLLLIVVAIILGIEMKGLLIGESASVSDQQKIAATIEGDVSVQRLIHMRTEHIGPDELLVAAKLELAPDMTVVETAEAVDRIETAVRRAVPSARIMYLEPDVFRTGVPDHEADDADVVATAGDATPTGGA